MLLAQGEFLAAQTLADAAALIATEPAALQLRYLQTLTEIAVEKNSTIVFPLPIDLVEPLTEMMRKASGASATSQNPPRNGALPPAPQADGPRPPSIPAPNPLQTAE